MFKPATYEEAKESFLPLRRVAFPKPALTTPRAPKARLTRSTAQKQPRKKKLSVGKLKKKAWAEFSIFVRTRDADAEGMVQCCTCDSVKHWKQMQAGHFIPGRLNSNLFDERGCHAQCSKCNVIFGGMGPKYYEFMLDAYGEEVIAELQRQNDVTHKWLPGELEGLLEKYKALNAQSLLLKEQ